MDFTAGLLRRLFFFLLHFRALLAVETVSEFGEDWPHSCVRYCLGDTAGINLGRALQCGLPFYNDCYCATAAASASRATSFLASCASTSCAAGDLSLDLSAMQSKYASYCMQNGFTQPGATNWYNPATATRAPAPGNTGAAGSTSTTTQLTVVTQTTTSGSNTDASSHQPRVTTIDATSTIWVNTAGSPVPAPSGGNSTTLALGLGLGLGVPLALAVAGFGLWMCIIRRKRRKQPHFKLYAPPQQMGGPPASSQSPISPKPVAAATSMSRSPSRAPGASELGDQGGRREQGGTGVQPSPDVATSPQVLVTAQHELHGVGRQPELPGQPRGPPPQYYQAMNNPGTAGSRDRWELP